MRVLEPAALAERADARPVIAWAPASSGGPYRFQLEARVPNGRVLAALDVSTSQASFRPPEALATEFAVVRVHVTSGCKEESTARVTELSPTFFVNPAAACELPREVHVERGRVTWASGPASARYEVAVFRASDGHLVSRGEADAIAGYVQLSPVGDPVVVAVRGRCGVVRSQAVYRVAIPGR